MSQVRTTRWTPTFTEKSRPISPEIDALPLDWQANHVEESPYEIFYTSPQNENTWDHPTLGPLPPNWKHCLCPIDENGLWQPRYWNDVTNEVTRENPRFNAEYLKARRVSGSSCLHTRVASSIVKNSPGLMATLHRAKVGTSQKLRDSYEIVHTIDPGDGTGPGAMNGGVFVVRVRGFPQLYVEKRFRENGQWELSKQEIRMLQKVRHGSLTLYCAGFIDNISKPKTASLYVEFCDRGSLEDIIRNYIFQRQSGFDVYVPELFLWHAFLGLADGFAYLYGGRSYLGDSKDQKSTPMPGWVPILHRDVKPDNVLLRSRSTLGTNKYFYCILTDFGLSCHDDGNDPWQKDCYALGTPHWLAPELCWHPYPKTQLQEQNMKLCSPHSAKSDIWALGACIYNLANPHLCVLPSGAKPLNCASAHLTYRDCPDELVNAPEWQMGRASRLDPLIAPQHYSKQLRGGLRYATQFDPKKRPNPIELVKKLKELMLDAGVTGTGPQKESDKLPHWATRVNPIYAKIEAAIAAKSRAAEEQQQ